MPSKSHNITKLLTLLCLATTLLGCQRTTVTQPALAQNLTNNFDDQLEFWHTLTDQPLLTNNDAFHGLLLFFDNDDPTQNYDQRVTLLKQRNWLDPNFDEPAQLAASRGAIAQILLQALNIKGGLTLQLFGSTPRYAIRELTHVGIYPPSTQTQAFSGFQFVSLISRIENHIAQTEAQAAQTPSNKNEGA